MTAQGFPELVKRRLAARYGARLDRVLLFGSRARGDPTPDSDWDFAVFLHDPCDDCAALVAAIEGVLE